MTDCICGTLHDGTVVPECFKDDNASQWMVIKTEILLDEIG